MAATTRSRGIPATAATPSRARAETTTLDFNGSNAAEKIDLSANGSRVRLFRDVANVTMDVNGIEGLNLNTLGSADTVTVNDLTGTDLKTASIDLSGIPGSGVGDGAADTVIENGTAGADRVRVVRSGPQVQTTRARAPAEHPRLRAGKRHAPDQHARG